MRFAASCSELQASGLCSPDSRSPVDPWRTDVPAKFINELGTEKLMFEAADPDVFAWYIKNYGADVNLFVDHSQVVQPPPEFGERKVYGAAS